MTVATGIIQAVTAILGQDRGDSDWGGSGLSTQITKTNKSAANAYVGDTFTDILTGKTGRVLMPVKKIDSKYVVLSLGMLLAYIFYKG